MILISFKKVIVNEMLMFPTEKLNVYTAPVPNASQLTISEIIEKLEYWTEQKISKDKVVCPGNDWNRKGTRHIFVTLFRDGKGQLTEHIEKVEFDLW